MISNFEAFATAILNTALESIITIDQDGIIQHVNPATEHIFGYSTKELIGANVSILMPEPDASEHDGYIARYLKTGQSGIIGIGREVTAKHKDGRPIPIHLSVSEFVQDGDLYFVGVIRDLTKQKLAEDDKARHEQALIREHNLLNSILESNISAVMLLNPEGKVVYANPSAEQIIGVTRRELEDRVYNDPRCRITAEDGGAFEDSCLPFRLVLESGQAVSDVRHAIEWPDGTRRILSCNGAPVHNAQGEIEYVAYSVADITDEVRAMQDLMHQKALFEALFNDAPEAIAMISRHHVIQMVNPAFCNLFGYSPEAIIDQPAQMLFSDTNEYNRIVDSRFRQHAQLASFSTEASCQARDAIDFPAEIVAGPFCNPEGELLGYLAFIRDISIRKQMQERLLLLNRAVEAAAEGITIAKADRDLPLVYVNPAFERLSGFTRTEIIGTNCRFLQGEDRDQTAILEMRAALRERRPIRVVLRNYRKDGSLFWNLVNIAPVSDSSGNVTHYVGIQEDITEQKQIEEALDKARMEAEQANRAKSRFLTNMSHELRTPMNAILGFAQLLEINHQEQSINDIQEIGGEITKAGRHLLELINDILDLSRIESGRIELCIEPVDPAAVYLECYTLMAPLAEARGIRLHWDGQSLAGIRIKADRTRLKQALLNYLSNAIKYNHENGHVKVTVSHAQKQTCRINVSDTGPGLSREQIESLFQPFQRLQVKEDRLVDGVGIGLTITKRLVELMGGRVGIDSQPGAGSTFWMELPMEQGPGLDDESERGAGDDSARRPLITRPDPSVKPATLLYIEDNPASMRLIASALSRFEHIELLTADSPTIGLELARSHQPDIILLDINLPVMDGYGVLREIQKDSALADTPVIAITAQAMRSDVERGLNTGFHNYLTKPINIRELLDTIETILAGRRLSLTGAD